MGRHGKKRAFTPVRTGLLGVSAAVAVGAVAVTSGLLPGGDTLDIRGSSAADQVRTGGAPDLLTQGGTTASPSDRASASTGTSRSSERPAAPSTSASPKKTSKPAATPSKDAKPSEQPTKAPTEKPSKKTSAAPAPKAPAAPKTSAPAPKPSAPASDATASTRAAVLTLVNQERAKVGCSPVSASRGLTSLAQNFSEDMAERGFFSHTDPDGASPWDRATKAGVLGLGAENIARGQADAQAVMDGWMNSDGHRANILNCDYKTLGVGVHFGSGGPWWTQDFGL
ncbi:CAP domain-containing protein [Streptomyces sp. NPDC055749]